MGRPGGRVPVGDWSRPSSASIAAAAAASGPSCPLSAMRADEDARADIIERLAELGRHGRRQLLGVRQHAADRRPEVVAPVHVDPRFALRRRSWRGCAVPAIATPSFFSIGAMFRRSPSPTIANDRGMNGHDTPVDSLGTEREPRGQAIGRPWPFCPGHFNRERLRRLSLIRGHRAHRSHRRSGHGTDGDGPAGPRACRAPAPTVRRLRYWNPSAAMTARTARGRSVTSSAGMSLGSASS